MKTITQKEPSVFGYRFSVKCNHTNRILGTGFFTSRQKMNKEEQISFVHEYTNGTYSKAFVSIDVFEAEA